MQQISLDCLLFLSLVNLNIISNLISNLSGTNISNIIFIHLFTRAMIKVWDLYTNNNQLLETGNVLNYSKFGIIIVCNLKTIKSAQRI